MTRLLLLSVVVRTVAQSWSGSRCSNDDDCSLNGVCAADADMTARGETDAREGVRGGNLARDPLRGRARVAQPTPVRRRGRVVRKSET